jgi:tetratricopeptide (TPR) repeat protein
MQAGDWIDARKQWLEVVGLEPGNAGAWSNLGKVEFRLKEYEAAADNLEKAISLRPALSDSWITLGFVYAELGAPMRAISCLTRAVHENPADPETRNALAIHLKRIGWTAAAESELLKAIDTEPKFAEAHFNLAVMYLERKPPAVEMARRHYITARQLGAAPDDEMEKQFAPGASDDPSDDPSAGKSGPETDASAKPTSPPAP